MLSDLVPTALGMIGAKSSMESVSQAAEGKLADIMYKGIDAQSKELTTNLSKLRDAGAEAAYNKKADLYSQLVSKRQKIDVLGNQIKATQLSPQEMQAYEKFSAQAQQIDGQLQQMKQQYDEMTKQAEQIQQSNLDNVTKQARLNQISGSYRQIEQKYNEGVKAYNDLQAQMQPHHELRASRPNDMTCPLCMFVAAKVGEPPCSCCSHASPKRTHYTPPQCGLLCLCAVEIGRAHV